MTSTTTFTIIFTIIIALVLLRAFWLRIKAASTRNDSFKQLPPKDQLSVLKECLLNNPTEKNLQNLKDFGEQFQVDFDGETYRPFMKRQLEIARQKNALAEDNELFAAEARWLDSILPLEFAEAKAALACGENATYIEKSLEGISRLYSDEAILDALEKLAPHYEKAMSLIDSYKELVDIREQSGASDEELEKLRKIRNKWDEDLLNLQQ
ncbi:MAG: hypothetical protein HUK19_00945 [Fibrobacter sp.]|nr:hypothetical protein [Fibrobacter sp.]